MKEEGPYITKVKKHSWDLLKFCNKSALDLRNFLLKMYYKKSIFLINSNKCACNTSKLGFWWMRNPFLALFLQKNELVRLGSLKSNMAATSNIKNLTSTINVT